MSIDYEIRVLDKVFLHRNSSVLLKSGKALFFNACV